MTFSLEEQCANKQTESIHSNAPLTDDSTKPVQVSKSFLTIKNSIGYMDSTSPQFLRQFSTSSLDFIHNHCIHSMSLNRTHLGRNHIRKKQPRTNPNYVQIQVPSDNGTIRSTYIRLNELNQSQITTLSSSTSTSSSEQDSILDCSQSFSNDSNGYFPSSETISTDKNQNTTSRRNEMKSSGNADEHVQKDHPSATARTNDWLRHKDSKRDK